MSSQWVVTFAFLALAAEAPSCQAAFEVAAVVQDDRGLAGAHDIEIHDGLGYVAGKGGALAILDLKQPAQPRMLWSTIDPATYEDAETVLPLGGNRLLVGTRDLLLFNVADAAKPGLLASLKDRPRIDRINGLVRAGKMVYGVNKQGYVVALELVGQNSLRLHGVREARRLDGLQSPHDIALLDGLLVIVDASSFGRQDRPGRLAVYRVNDTVTGQPLPPEQWTMLGKLEHQSLAGANRVMARGQFAYVGSCVSPEARRESGLGGNVVVVDVQDAASPRLRGAVPFPDARGPNGLELSGNVVFAAGGQTIQAVDVSDPERPRELANLRLPEVFTGGDDDAHDLVYHDGHLFVTAQTTHAVVILRVVSKRIRQLADLEAVNREKSVEKRRRHPQSDGAER